MRSKRFIILLFFVSITQLIFLKNVFAQSEDSIKYSDKKYDLQQEELILVPNPINFQPLFFNETNLNLPNVEYFISNKKKYSFENKSLVKKMSFKQVKIENKYFSLGAYELFQNSFIINASKKIKLDFGFGLLKQGSVLSPFRVNYNYTFNSSVEYLITPWLSAYMHGQYIIPKNNNNFDPLTYMNPLFYQTEFGGGLKAKYKNMKVDVGLKKIIDTQFKQSDNYNPFNTKISIGF